MTLLWFLTDAGNRFILFVMTAAFTTIFIGFMYLNFKER